MIDERVRSAKELMEALRQYPELLEEIRKIILTEEIFNIPKKLEELSRKLDNFIKSEHEPISEKVDNLSEKVDNLSQDFHNFVENEHKPLAKKVDKLSQDFQVLFIEVKKLKDDVAMLKGDNLEMKVRQKAPAYFGRMIRRCKVIDHESLLEVLEDAVDKGLITEEEKDDTIEIDVVVSGRPKTDPNSEVLLAVEVSYIVDKKDVERAIKRSSVISKSFNLPTIAVCLGQKITRGAKNNANNKVTILSLGTS
ncbi:MAG: hypothetical protein RMJ37_06700 [Spirochaetia bacterium]|nr:hypothetical protein [Spirochaetota bacterium]MDW8113004.1 hypothetical protein [Spirochaetia bacterium]